MIRIARSKLIINGKKNSLVEPSLARAANLAGTTAATLSINFATIKAKKQDVVAVKISTDETNWPALDKIKGMAKKQTRSYDITPYATENTWIRFRVYNLNSNHFKGVLKLEYVEISRD
jgi:protein tyrosine phosphatase